MSSLDYFTAGLTKAVARRSKKQPAQHVQKVDNNASKVVTNNTTIPESTDRLCKATIIEEMTALIKQRKMK